MTTTLFIAKARGALFMPGDHSPDTHMYAEDVNCATLQILVQTSL